MESGVSTLAVNENTHTHTLFDVDPTSSFNLSDLTVDFSTEIISVIHTIADIN